MDTSWGRVNQCEDDKDILSSNLSQRLCINAPSMRSYMFQEEEYRYQAPPLNVAWIEEKFPILTKVEALIVYNEGFMDENGYFKELETERAEIHKLIRNSQSVSVYHSGVVAAEDRRRSF
jgi:hypothetical protein